MRVFPIVWEFGNPADGNFGLYSTNDNPFPIYPAWAARPLHKPLPYPKMSPTELDDLRHADRTEHPRVRASPTASPCTPPACKPATTSAWKRGRTRPWLLQFMTNSYPNVPGPPYTETWRRKPCLIVDYFYDPETIDHATGALL